MIKFRNLNLLVVTLVVVLTSKTYAVENQSDLSGKQLVDIYCTRCHLAPHPSDLPEETWPIVLAWMGNYLGIINNDERIRPDRIVRREVLKEPIISPDDFTRLQKYLISNAPTQSEILIQSDKLPEIKGFKIVYPNIELAAGDYALSVAIDEARNQLYLGTEGSSGPGVSVFDLKSNKKIGGFEGLESVPIHIYPTPAGFQVLTMGGKHENTGKGQVIDIEGFGSTDQRVRIIADGLNRSTDIKWGDLNGDSIDDMVFTGFGNRADPIEPKGRVSVFWQTPEYSSQFRQKDPSKISDRPLSSVLRETVLFEEEGNLGIVISDFNKDGKPDFMTLKANARQQLILFLNKGNEQFEQQVIEDFRPSYGHLSFSGADFNHDGHLDLLVNTGNNQELGVNRPTRPYHGIRVWENNGDLTFTERYFFPMHGATWSTAVDFDGDGDLDIVGVSFFPSILGGKSSETFVYLENKGNYLFEASTLPDNYLERWVSMAVGDINGDQKPDIVLGRIFGTFRKGQKEMEVQSQSRTESSAEQVTKHTGKEQDFRPILFLINENE